MARKDYLNKSGLKYYHDKAKRDFDDILNQDGIVSESGSSIEIDNGLEAPLKDLTLYGNTEQNSTSGKNLLPESINTYANILGLASGSTSTRNGYTYKRNDDQSITISGSSTGDTAVVCYGMGKNSGTTWEYDNGYILPAGDYKIVWETDTVSDALITVWRYTSSGYIGALGVKTESNVNLSGAVSLTLDGNTAIALGIVGKSTQNTIKLMVISASETDYTYEPYTNGVSPNPEYPQDIKVVTGRNEVEVKGKNLWINPSIIPIFKPENASGSTTTRLSDNSFVINVVKSDTADSSTFCEIPLDISYFKPNTTYTLSKQNSVTGTQFANAGALRTKINNNYGATQNTDSISFTTPSNITSLALLFYGFFKSTESGEATITIYDIQLEESPTTTTYEPYQSNTYEINLGKNLFDKDNANIIKGYISASSVIVSAPSTDAIVYIPCKSNTTYTVQKMLDATISNNRFRLMTTSEVPSVGMTGADLVRYDSGTTVTSASITTSSNAKYLLVYCLNINATSETTLEDMLSSIQIEQGSEATTYTPYFEPIELCKIGDYQDKIYKENDKWYLHKETIKFTIPNTITGRMQNNNRRYYVSNAALGSFNIIKNLIVAQSYGLYSNILSEKTANQTWDGNQGISYDYNVGHNVTGLDFSINGLSTEEEYKNAIIGSEVLAILNEPTTTEITNTELIEQLEAISTLTGKNYIDLDCVEGHALASAAIIAYTNSVNGKYESLKNKESNVDLSDYYTKEEVDNLFNSIIDGNEVYF